MIFFWCDCVPFLLFTWIFGTYLHTYIYTYILTYIHKINRLNLSCVHWNWTGEVEASLNMLTPNSSPNSGSIISFMYTKTFLWPYSSAFLFCQQVCTTIPKTTLLPWGLLFVIMSSWYTYTYIHTLGWAWSRAENGYGQPGVPSVALMWQKRKLKKAYF